MVNAGPIRVYARKGWPTSTMDLEPSRGAHPAVTLGGGITRAHAVSTVPLVQYSTLPCRSAGPSPGRPRKTMSRTAKSERRSRDAHRQ